MSRHGSIDVLQPDRGLSSCFKAANLMEAWTKEFIRVHTLETLDDFIFMARQDKWEDSIEEMVKAVPSVKDNRVALARFKAAWECGNQAIKLAASTAAKTSDASMDEVLPESTMATVTRDFRAKYGIEVEAQLEPADALRSRIYREFRKGTMAVLEVKKIRSVLTQANPRVQESVQLAGGLQLQFDRDAPFEVGSTVAYYFSLRTLCYAWAWGGLFIHKDPDGVERTFLGLSEAQAYADEALRSCMEFGHGSMAWLARVDLLCRGKMATYYIRRGWSGHQSLKMALQDTHLEWRSSSLQRVVEPPSKKRPPEPLEQPKEPKRPREIKKDQHKTVSMVRGGQKLCKRWNDGRKCDNKNCPDLHACDIKLDSGKPCLSRDHTRLTHFGDE